MPAPVDIALSPLYQASGADAAAVAADLEAVAAGLPSLEAAAAAGTAADKAVAALARLILGRSSQ